VLVVVGLFGIGIIGFFAMCVVLVVRVLGFLFRGLTGARQPKLAQRRFEPRHEVCPHPRCGHVNRHEARFCARCGRPLGEHDDVDAYG
jgi:hypothetical protein